MLAVVWRLRIGDVQKVPIEVVQVRLNEAELEGNEDVGISAATE